MKRYTCCSVARAMYEAPDGSWVRYEEVEVLTDEIKRLRENQVQHLRTFLDSHYPKVDGPGWLGRDGRRALISEFLSEFDAAEKAGEKA